jgi:hypothetical protein
LGRKGDFYDGREPWCLFRLEWEWDGHRHVKGEVADRKSRRDTARCLTHGGGIYDTL